jgi:hypothetical protein
LKFAGNFIGNRLRTLEITTYERKAVPFLQAMADQRFLGLEDRKKMAWDAVLRGLGSDASHKEATRYETELDTLYIFEMAKYNFFP